MNTVILRSNIITKIVLALFLLFLCFVGYTQDTIPFKQQWRQVDSLVKLQRPASAIKYLQEIETEALATKNETHYIMAKGLHISFERYKSERGPTHLNQLEAEVMKAQTPVAKALWSTITANAFYNYFENNRNLLYNNRNFRDSSDNYEKHTVNQILNKTKYHYLQALKEEKALQGISIKTYAPLFEHVDKHLVQNDNLYISILLAALDFFKNQSQFSYFDEANKKQYIKLYLVHHDDFMHMAFSKSDSTQNLDIAMRLYQDLMHYYQVQNDLEKVIFYEIKRIEYLKGSSNNQEQILAFKQLLDRLSTDYPRVRNTAKAKYLSVNISEGYKNLFYSKGAESFTQQLVKEYLEIIERQPATEGAMLAYNRLNKLLAKNVDITTEKVVLPGVNIRALVQYTNVDTINIRIFKTAANPFVKHIAKTDRPYCSNSFTLPKGNDLETHSVELNLGQLPVGHYAIVITTDSITLTKELQVSNVLILDNDLEQFSLHRKTGQPLPECDQFFILNQSGSADWISMDIPETYGTSLSEQKKEWIKDRIEARANDRDSFPDKYDHTVYLGYVSNKDTLIQTESIYFPMRKKVNTKPNPEKEKKNIHTYYFVDRPIYRPGQQVHFKGFVVNSDRAAKHIMQANKNIKVLIDDVAGNTIFEKTFISNEFGTFSGSFTIPEDGPLGLYDISDSEDYGYGDFSVEAYKKPQLQVRFDEGTKTLPPNQLVTIGGTVNYLSGAPASFCSLTAYIQKMKMDKTEYLYANAAAYHYDRFRGEDYLDTVLTTDEKGRFELSFYSETDTFYSDGSKYPYSLFEVEVLAKDQTGEETSEREIYTSNISPYAIHFYVNSKDLADSFKSINLAILNHDKQPVVQKVRLKISELKKPGVFLKERLWQAPTDLYYTADSMALLFPGEETGITPRGTRNSFYDEKYNLLHQRKVIRTIIDTTLSNDQIKNMQFSKNDWPHSTYYKFEVWDPQGYLDSSDAVQYSFIYNNDDPGITDEPIVILNNNNTRADQQQTINIATFTPDAYLFFHNPINKYATTQKSSQFDWNGQFANAYRLSMTWCFIYDNRIYQKRSSLYNPSNENNIDFKINIPQQVLQPGQKVSWPVQVNAQGKQKIRYELIATLYDAALDKLVDDDYEGWINRKLYQYSGRKYTQYPEAFWRASSIKKDSKGQRYLRPDLVFKNRSIPSLRLFGTNVMLQQLYKQTINLGTIILEDNQTDEASEVTVFGKKIDKRTYVGALSNTTVVNGYAIESNTTAHLNAGNIRKNFTESAYFNAHLKTDKKGRAFINFTVPDALTKWKLKIFAHDKSLNTVTFETEIISQKELMVNPHLPRFLRQQDSIDLRVKLSNLNDKTDTVIVHLALTDSISGKDINSAFGLSRNRQEAVLAPHSSQFVIFSFKTPGEQENPVQLLVTAKGKRSEDGELHTLNIEPVKLVLTENLQVYLNEKVQDTFAFPAFNSKFNQVASQSLTVKPDNGPVWSALNAYAYLATYPYNCTEQLLNKYLGLSMAKALLDSFPVLRTQINERQNAEAGHNNKQELANLKALQQLNEQTKNNAALFKAFEQFAERQNKNGSFSWFEGMPQDHQITIYVVSSLARIAKFDWSKQVRSKLDNILAKGIDYIDITTIQHLNELKKKKKPVSLDQGAIDWLYLNSFFPGRKMDALLEKYTEDLYHMAQSEWSTLDNKNQATIALCLYSRGQQTLANNIVQALYEKSIHQEAMGRYWNWNAQLNWTAGDIAAHTRILEAFSVIHKKETDITAIRLWLMQNKSGAGWGTTMNTAAAILALASDKWEQQYKSSSFSLQLGDTGFVFNTVTQQAISPAYAVDKSLINAEMGSIIIKKETSNKAPVSAHVSWSYEQDLSTVNTGNNGATVQIDKKIYKSVNHKETPILLKEKDKLKVGDKLLVRINITCNRDLSYLLLKDMRCTATEPVEKISTFKYKNDLAYYQSHNDKASDFFFNHIKKGNWYLEYEVLVNQSGSFQSGIATLEDMYQPEINAYSSGIKLNIQ